MEGNKMQTFMRLALLFIIMSNSQNTEHKILNTVYSYTITFLETLNVNFYLNGFPQYETNMNVKSTFLKNDGFKLHFAFLYLSLSYLSLTQMP